MAYNFKNLADVELLDAIPEEANVLVEVNGTTKRAPQAASGGYVKLFVVKHIAHEDDPALDTFEPNMTYEELKAMLEADEPPMFVCKYTWNDDGAQGITYNCKGSYGLEGDVIHIFGDGEFKYTSDGKFEAVPN